MPSQKRRLIPISDRRFQFKYTGIIMLVAAVVSTALGALLLDAYRQMNAMIEINEAIGERLDHDSATQVFYLVIAFLAAEVVFLGALGLVITNRVCGPIFVIQRHLESLASGVYPRLRPLRAGDEFKSAFDAVSELVNALQARDARELEELRALQEQLRASESGAEASVLESIARQISEREARVKAP